LTEVNAKTAGIHSDQNPKTAVTDLEINFAGKKVKYPKMTLNVLEWKLDEAHLEGEIILSLKDFGITPPDF
jgi:hypothetical protein